MRLRNLLVTTVVSLLAPAGALPQQVVGTESVAASLVARMALQQGERVLLVGAAGRADALVAELRKRMAAAGAEDLGALAVEGPAPESWQTAFTRNAPSDRTGLARYLSSVDLAIMMPGATVTHAAYAAMQDVLRSGRGRTIHFHWIGAYELDGSVREMNSATAALYERVLRDTDYRALAAVQSAFERAARSGEVRVTTPDGTDITFRIADRPVTRQDGDASAARARTARNLIDREVELPAGAIRVAPIEESVNGTIAFPASMWGGGRAEGLVMRFTGGKVTSWTARSGSEGVARELASAGEAGRSFREFALGFNPLLAIPEAGDRWIPYYGYGAGVIRLSLGDNTELGGNVGGGWVRWNFFTEATVSVGGVTWVTRGVLTPPAPAR